MVLSTRAISLQLKPLSLVTLLALSALAAGAHAAPGSDDRTVWLKPAVSAPTSAKAPSTSLWLPAKTPAARPTKTTGTAAA